MITHRSMFSGIGVLAPVLICVSAARADEKADALLKEVETATMAVKTLTADLHMSQSYKTPDGKDQMISQAAATLKLKKPNLARIELAEGSYAKTIASDGTNLYTLLSTGHYQKDKVDAQGKNITTLWAVPVSMFFNGQFSMSGRPDRPSTTYAGKQTLEGVEYDVVQLRSSGASPYSGKLYIAPSKLATRLELQIPPIAGSSATKLEAVLTNVQLNAPLTEASFAYTLPAGTTRYTPPGLDDYTKKLLPIGSVAPSFRLSAPTGGRVELAEALKGKKAVLVNFWFDACVGCRDEFPHLQELYAKFKDSGLEMIALNGRDSADVINRYVKETHLTFLIGMKGKGDNDKTAQQYRVVGYPTTYLLDSGGKIVFRSVGFDEEGLLAALEKLGFK